jgi:hypothetical protein
MSQQINLFNPIFMKQRKYFSLLTMLQSLGLIVLGSLLFYGYAVYQVEQLSGQSAESLARYNAEQARFARLVVELSPQQANQLLQDEVRQLEKRLSDQAELISTLKSDSFGNISGYSEYMRAFSRQAVPGLWLTGFKVTGDAAHISLSGAVLNPELLPAYIQRLGREHVMQGKNFSTLAMQQAKPELSKAGKNTLASRYVEFTLYSTPESEANK